MQPRPQIFLIVCIMLGLASCSIVDDTLLTEEIDEFSRGAVVLTAIIESEFELAEDLNTLGFMDNLEFQLELGGHPEPNFKPLFKAMDIAARKNLLTALEGYAETLAVVASGQSISSVYRAFSGAAENLKSLSSDNFSIGHSLSLMDSGQLVSDLSLFDELLILPARDRRLLPIVQKGNTTLKKAATLLYFDIGAPEDQSSKCSYTFPKNDLDATLSSIRLCKGGLRAIVKSAVKFDANIWTDKLAQSSQSDTSNTLPLRDVIRKIVSIQKLGLSFDKLLSDTQAALVAMVAAHKAISDTLKAAQKSRLSSLPAALKSSSFQREVQGLLKAAAETKSVLLELTDNSVTAQNDQTTPTTLQPSGKKDDNQQ
ncbi:MAG: hypothetical protein WDZ54_11185 [Sneathiella sp.]